MNGTVLATEAQLTFAIADCVEPQLRTVLAQAKPKHRLRVASLPAAIMNAVAERLHDDPRWAVRVHSENAGAVPWKARATKLVELRDHEPRPLLVFLPPGLRTPAEDSLDIATFTELTLGDVLDQVIQRLVAKLPAGIAEQVSDALEYLRIERALPAKADVARFLLSVVNSGGDFEKAGRALALLGLVPDLQVLSDPKHLRRRLSRNRECTKELTDDRRPLQERIARLKLEPGDFPSQLFAFLRPRYTRPATTWGEAIALDPVHAHLTFEKWKFVDQPASTELTLTMLPLALPRQVPDSVGQTQSMPILNLEGKAGLKLAFKCTPSPAQVPEWKHFRLRIMKPEADGPVVAWESNNYAAPKGRTSKSTRTIKVSALQDLEEGTYYAQVDAFGADGALLNNSKPRDPEDPSSLKENESEYFLAVRGDAPVDDPKPRAVFVVSFEEAHGDIWAKALGQSKKAGADVPSRDTMTGSWREARTAAVHGDAHFVFESEGVEGFTIRLPGALRRVELSILESPDRLGCFRLDYRDARNPGDVSPSVRDEVPGFQIYKFKAFLDARAELFSAILKQHKERGEPGSPEFRLGVVETADLLALSDLIVEYARTFHALTELVGGPGDHASLTAVVAMTDLVEVRWRSQQAQSDPGRALLLGPTHPLRMLWHLRHAMSAAEVLTAWQDGSKSAANFRALYEEIQHLIRPQCMPLVLFDHRGRGFSEQELLTPHWSLFLPTEHDSQRVDLAACRDTARRLLGIKRTTAGAAVTARDLAGRIVEFVRLHPYVEQVHINLFHPGDGQLLADTLQAAEQLRRKLPGSDKFPLPELRYAVNMFTAPGKVSDAGLALEALLDPERQVSDDDEFSLVTGDHLYPKLVFSRNPVETYLRSPHDFEAHISVLLEQFRVEGRLRDLSEMGRGSFADGLINEAQTLNLPDQQFAWVRGVNATGATRDPVGSLIVSSLDGLQRVVAAHASGEEAGKARPALALALKSEDQSLIRQVHDASTWVLTIDRNLGLDFFDRPSATEHAGYLLDFTPEYVQEERQRLLLTTKSDEELESLVRSLLKPALSLRRGTEATVLEALRSLSGRLALRLLGGPSKHAEVLGLLMARWMLERAGLLQNYVLIPVDNHQDWFRVDGDDEADRRRADLLLVGADEATRTIEVHIIEVKLRRDLQPVDRASLYQGMAGQAQNTRDRFRRRFDPRYFPKDRADFQLRVKELSTLLTFYLGRSQRYELVDEDRAGEMRTFFESLDAGYRLRFRMGGVVFVQEDQGFQVDDIEPDLPVYRFGSDYAQELLDEAVDKRAEDVERRRSRTDSDGSGGGSPRGGEDAPSADARMVQLREMLAVSTLTRRKPRKPSEEDDLPDEPTSDNSHDSETKPTPSGEEEPPPQDGANDSDGTAPEEPAAASPTAGSGGPVSPVPAASASVGAPAHKTPVRPPATVAAAAGKPKDLTASDPNSGVRFEIGMTSREVLARPLALHPSNTALSHLNIGIVGDMGTGKTQLTKYLVTRFALGTDANRGQKPKFLIFDYKKDYSRPDFVQAVGAKCVSPESIPLNILRIPPKPDGSPPRRRDWVMRARFLYDALSKIYSGVGPVQRKRLVQAVVDSYKAAEDEGQDAPLLSEVRDRYAESGKPDSVDSILSDLVDLEVFTDDREEVQDFGEFFEGVVVVKLNELGADQQLKNTLVVFFLNLFYDWMLRVEKKPFIGREPQLRFIEAMLLIDEADNIMQYDFAVLQQVLQQGREFGVGVLLASQYLSHFFKRSSFDYREPLLTWFIHRIPNVTIRDLEGIGLSEVRQETANVIKELENHEYLCKTLDVDGVFGVGRTFWKLRQDAWIAQHLEAFGELVERARREGKPIEALLRGALDSNPPELA